MNWKRKEAPAPEVGVIGLTVTGLAWAAVLAEAGLNVLATDVDEEVAAGILEEMHLPGAEPELAALVQAMTEAGRLRFCEQPRQVIRECPVIGISCMTPAEEDGLPSPRFVISVVRQVAGQATGDRVLAIKSALPPGMAEKLQQAADTALAERDDAMPSVSVVAMPELFNDGQMVAAMRRQDPLVVGRADAAAELPASLIKVLDALDPTGKRRQFCSWATAELAAFADSGLVALRQAYGQAMSALAETMQADSRALTAILEVAEPRRRGRIAARRGGIGVGGKRLPAETAALTALFKQNGLTPTLTAAVTAGSAAHTKRCTQWLKEQLAHLPEDAVVAVLGLAPSPGTDDLRETPGIEVLKALAADFEDHPPAAGRPKPFRLYLPWGADQAKWRLHRVRDAFAFCTSAAQATRGADVLITLGRWPGMSRGLGPALKTRMRGALILDGASAFDREKAERLGFSYRALLETAPAKA
ncbi:UDP binding domain-containing protein [Pseudoramibacter sp. HA2172]|uniref:UDP binding domain-containing protein n=1 Tax=Pseudoramibacter faecis TaxID=3108534 RepID=UPI002E77B164|nr:UDP binding domain-containing protein [Pseudoramibacter sp. HA2172]